MNNYHVPVLLKETIDLLQVNRDKKYIDCTFGGGGHTKAILSAGGKVLAIDCDLEAISNATESESLKVVHGNFANLKEIADKSGFGKVDGILLDLGVSSHQLDTDYRGFSFNKDAPLDMRMDPENQTVTAADLVNAGSEKELASLFWKFGEEQFGRQIARQILESRKQKQVMTTKDLVEIIFKVKNNTGVNRIHPATKVFQALRIAVNDELNNIDLALNQAAGLLKTGGRLVVISFHSLEDKIIKNFLNKNTNDWQILTIKPVTAGNKELLINPRARSSKLRAAIRV